MGIALVKMRAVYTGQGTYRVHAATCRDAIRDQVKHQCINMWTFEAEDTHAAAVELWGDVASDNYRSGSDRWHEECDTFADSATVYLPCCEELPERYHHTDPRASAHLAGA